MRFVNGICLECKHEIQIDTNKITATCPFCVSLYNVEETINQKDNLLYELNENKKIKKLYHDVEKGVSVSVQNNIQLCINTTNNIIGYILLIQISNKEKEVLNTYYLEARDKNYIDLKPTIDKFNNYGIIDLYIQIKISTEKNKIMISILIHIIDIIIAIGLISESFHYVEKDLRNKENILNERLGQRPPMLLFVD